MIFIKINKEVHGFPDTIEVRSWLYSVFNIRTQVIRVNRDMTLSMICDDNIPEHQAKEMN